MIKEAAPLPAVEPNVADTHTVEHAELVYTRADGTVEYAESAQDAIDRCPVLGDIAIKSPETAKYLLELAAAGNAKLDEQKAEETKPILAKVADTKLFDVQSKSESIPASDTKPIHVENSHESVKLNEIITNTTDVVIIQETSDDNFDALPPEPRNLKDFMQIDKSLHIEQGEGASNTQPEEITKEDEVQLVEATTESIDIIASSDRSVNAIEIVDIKNTEKLPIHETPRSEIEVDPEAATYIELTENQDEFISNDFFDTTEIMEPIDQNDFNIEVEVDPLAELFVENISEFEEVASEVIAHIEPSKDVAELFNVIADSANEEPLETTFEILTESLGQNLEAPERIVLEDVITKIAEVVEILNVEITNNEDHGEVILSPEAMVVLRELIEILGYAKPEIIIEEYLQNHSIEQLHQVLSGLYKAYSEDEKKELFGKSFTNLQYLQDSKQKISKHIFTLIVRGRLFYNAA